MKFLIACIFIVFSLIAQAASAGTWSAPVKDYALQYGVSQPAPLDPAYPNTRPAENNCTVGQYWRYYTIIQDGRLGRRVISFYTQNCI